MPSLNDSGYSHLGVKISSMTYHKVITAIANAWEQQFGEPMPITGYTPTDRFTSVLELLKSKLQSRMDFQGIAEQLDIPTPDSAEDLIAEVSGNDVEVAQIQDMDDLTPNQVKQAIYEVAAEMGSDDESVDVPMNIFLRNALKRIGVSASIELRMNVGANRHFPRLIQWLRECEAETDWGDDGRGIRIKNASGRGRVAEYPVDPKTLKVTINRSFL